MKFKIQINSVMTTGHKFTDVFYCNEYDNDFIEGLVLGKAIIRGFETKEVDDYQVEITNCI